MRRASNGLYSSQALEWKRCHFAKAQSYLGLRSSFAAGGFGVFENGQVGWGLDFPGGEAIVAAVNPTSGFAGIMISADVEQHRERALFMTDKDGQTLLQLNDASGRSRAVFSVKGGDAPALQAFDDKGGVIRDALAAGKR